MASLPPLPAYAPGLEALLLAGCARLELGALQMLNLLCLPRLAYLVGAFYAVRLKGGK